MLLPVPVQWWYKHPKTEHLSTAHSALFYSLSLSSYWVWTYWFFCKSTLDVFHTLCLVSPFKLSKSLFRVMTLQRYTIIYYAHKKADEIHHPMETSAEISAHVPFPMPAPCLRSIASAERRMKYWIRDEELGMRTERKRPLQKSLWRALWMK